MTEDEIELLVKRLAAKLEPKSEGQAEFEAYLAQRRESSGLPALPIEKKEFPIPVETRGGTREQSFESKYPFEFLEIGDSFWVPDMVVETFSSYANRFSKKSGWKFVCRGQTKDGRPGRDTKAELRGVRVWRVG